LDIALRTQTPKHIRGGWSHYADTSEPGNANGDQNMVNVQSGFRISDLSITDPTRLPTALTGPINKPRLSGFVLAKHPVARDDYESPEPVAQSIRGGLRIRRYGVRSPLGQKRSEAIFSVRQDCSGGSELYSSINWFAGVSIM
jgi:hypothetical protein